MKTKRNNQEARFTTVKVRPSVHKELVEISAATGLKIYAVIRVALDLYQKTVTQPR